MELPMLTGRILLLCLNLWIGILKIFQEEKYQSVNQPTYKTYGGEGVKTFSNFQQDAEY